MFRVGLGSDIHRLVEGRPLILGGIPIQHPKGLLGHSDADVVLHALTDALLGAAGLGDLGQYFPESPENKDRSSSEILREVCVMVWERGFKVINADLVVMAEEPKIQPYKEAMVEKISGLLNIDKNYVGVKATTCEGLGAIGRGEGIFSQAVILLEKVHGK